MAPEADPPPPPASLGSKIWQSRWIVLVASFWIQACAGIGYAFGSYSPLIKTSLGYTQQEVNILGNAKDFGDSIGLLAGYLCEILPTWGLLLVGALQNLVGYGWLWLIVTQRVAALPFWAICILMFIGTNGETYFNTTALVTNVRNFPKSRGHVVGLLKGFTGLCGAIFTQIYTTFFAPDEAAYLFIVAIGPTMVAIFVMFIIRPIRVKSADSTRSESIGFTFIYGVCLVLASYLMGVLIVQDIVTVSFSVSLTITVILLFLILLPLAAPIVSWFVRTRRPIARKGTEAAESASMRAKRVAQINDDAEIVAPLLPEQIPAAELGFTADDLGQDEPGLSSGPGSFTGSVGFSELEDEKLLDLDDVPPEKLKQHEHAMHKVESRKLLAAAEGAVGVSSKRRPRRGEDFTLLQALVKADFWLLFWSLLCGAASGLTAIDNMGQMSESQGYSNANIFVSMMSIWNFLGRLVGGYGSEVLARKYALPRSWALVAAQAVMVVGHFLFAMAWPGTLYVGTLLVGIGYGSHWGIVPPIISEIFGLKNFGMLYNVYTIANPAGSFVFSGILAGYLYDLEAAKQNAVGAVAAALHPSSMALFSESESNTCYGAVCFRLTFLIMSGVCLVGMVLSVILSIRTQVVYKSLYGKSPSEIAATRS